MILEEFSGTPYYILFNISIYGITLVNIIYLCTMSYPMTEQTASQIVFVNIFCSSIFVVEIIFKIMVLGCKSYFIDKLNIADFIVVGLGIVEIIVVRISPNPDGKFNINKS